MQKGDSTPLEEEDIFEAIEIADNVWKGLFKKLDSFVKK